MGTSPGYTATEPVVELQATTIPPGPSSGVPDEFYDRFSDRRKLIIVSLLSFGAFLSPISSTMLLSATPEIAAGYHTNGSIVNLSNALYMVSMGISPLFWGPLSQVYGRRMTSIICTTLFTACNLGTALSPNLASFFIFRILAAFEGTALLLLGSACIEDIYRPVERGTAMGFFLAGTVVGPAFGPVIGGIMVTYASWRDIFWLQTALAGVSVVGTVVLLPETIYKKRLVDMDGFSALKKTRTLWGMMNPWTVLRLYAYPNIIAAGFAAAAVTWNMYSILTPIRYVINPRFHLESPMKAGFFYLAPGCGYLVGTFIGGRYADHVVKHWIKKRGTRVPEDRLRSSIPFMGFVTPVSVLIYGWGVDKEVGGIPLVVITLFLQGVAQLFCFPCYNAYCLDVIPGRGAEVMAANYVVRYLFAGFGTAIILPATEAIGVGWANTISVVFLLVSTAGTLATIRWGQGWREAINERSQTRELGS